MPFPQDLIKKTSSWSDSSSNQNSNSKNVEKENYFAKPLAVRDKFVFDPEHGGGRRRRNKRKVPMFISDLSNANDLIGCSTDLNTRLGLQESSSGGKVYQKEEDVFMSPNPFEMAKEIKEMECDE